MKTLINVLVILFFPINIYAQTNQDKNLAYLNTAATVDTLVTPDRIYLSILLTEKDTKNKISVEESEKRLKNKLTELGIDVSTQLTLDEIYSNFQTHFLRGADVIKSKSFTLLVYDAQTAGKVITGLESVNISNVFIEKKEYSKMEQLKILLKSRAVHKAIAQAKAMLAPLHQKLIKAVYITDLFSDNSGQIQGDPGSASGLMIRGTSTVFGYKAHRFSEAIYGERNINFDKIKVSSTVKIKFVID